MKTVKSDEAINSKKNLRRWAISDRRICPEESLVEALVDRVEEALGFPDLTVPFTRGARPDFDQIQIQ